MMLLSAFSTPYNVSGSPAQGTQSAAHTDGTWAWYERERSHAIPPPPSLQLKTTALPAHGGSCDALGNTGVSTEAWGKWMKEGAREWLGAGEGPIDGWLRMGDERLLKEGGNV